jgi:hypothetical protein
VPAPLGFFHLYEARVEVMPELVIERREITEARFVRPTLLYEMRYRTVVVGGRAKYKMNDRSPASEINRVGQTPRCH